MLIMVSVVIPAYNEERSIKLCLTAFTKQTTNAPFEVILVNNNSTDSTLEVALTFKDKINLKIINEKKQGRGAARVTGFRKAKGSIILSTDADTVVPRDWIKNMLKHFENPKVVAVTGPWKIRSRSKVRNFTAYHFQRLSLPCLTGLNFGIRKEIYDKVGGFDPTLKAQEDIEITPRVRKLGKIKYSKDVVVLTSSRRYRNGLLKGLWDYQKVSIYNFLLKDKSKTLPDVRNYII